jgi:hypothetical protein
MRKQLLRGVVAAAVLVGATQLVSFGTAGATYPGLTGETECLDDGQWKATFTGSSDTTNYGAHQWEITNPSGLYSPDGLLASTQTATRMEVYPASTTSVVETISIMIYLPDGRTTGGSATTTVYQPNDCEPPDLGEGRFTGGGHQIRVDGVRVTRGLTIHCDLLLSNNLQINWLGNQFHMLEHLTTVECSDDPDITQAPPPAPLDTLIGTGSGRYNGNEGYSIEFTLVDQGEPGRNDQMAILITEDATGTEILNVPLQTLSGGNLQAHYDQPHK